MKAKATLTFYLEGEPGEQVPFIDQIYTLKREEGLNLYWLLVGALRAAEEPLGYCYTVEELNEQKDLAIQYLKCIVFEEAE